MNFINRIVIIGNGFDLAHNLDTRYEDFINWYWNKRISKLTESYNSNDNDGLCSFSTNDNSFSWKNAIHTMNYKSWKDFISYFGNKDSYNYSMEKSLFMNQICKSIKTKGWVDIETEYYNALNSKNYIKQPDKLNDELKKITALLVEYLNTINGNISNSIVKKEIQQKIFSPIKIKEISVSASDILDDFIIARLKYYSETKNTDHKNYFIGNVIIDSNDYVLSFEIDHLINKYETIIKNNKIDDTIKKSIAEDDVFKHLLYPDRLMLLNFNYTNTADLYIGKSNNRVQINHIHGELSDPNSIIFGYGDELDDKYQDLVRLNNNEHLKNIKSIKYLETDNYRKMLEFINSAPYQIYIMGHSCGNSDRTLLNTLFEHKNCISIKPFYYIKKDGTGDSYLETIQNISRNFTDMKLMRDRVVNKKYCEPIQKPEESNNQ